MLAYLLIILRNDKELDRLVVTVHHLIQNEAADIKGYITINDLFPIMQDKITTRNDNQITKHHNPSQRDISVFIDNCGNDIRTTCTTIKRERKANSHTTE